MNKLIKSSTVIALISLVGTASLADTPKLDNRQDKQQARIAQGIKSGELTK